MTLPVVATAVWGHTNPAYHSHPVKSLRYELPLIFFPLFAGWALLPPPNWRFAARAGLAGCAAAIAISIPKMTRIDFAAMDPFGTPFQKCFAENAQNRKWTGGISNFYFALPLHHNPNAGRGKLHMGGLFTGAAPLVNPKLPRLVRLEIGGGIPAIFNMSFSNLHEGRVFLSSASDGRLGLSCFGFWALHYA